MKRSILSLLSVALLLMAGSVMAQTDYGGANQPAEASADTVPAESPAQQGSTGSTAEPSMPSQDPANGSTYDESGTPTQTGSSANDTPVTSGSQAHGSLPRTASDLPLVFAFGVIGAASLLALRASRIRRAH